MANKDSDWSIIFLFPLFLCPASVQGRLDARPRDRTWLGASRAVWRVFFKPQLGPVFCI